VPNTSPSAGKGGYEDSLIRLIKMTEQHVYEHVAADASVMASVAQRMDLGLNIKASIK
jgi:hypothetical protein